MADFKRAFEKTLLAEGGYKLTNIKGDNGKQTYAGISRKYHPDWVGWAYVDRQQTPPADLVRDFYKSEFWDKISGDKLLSQGVAESIYDFGVNADWRVSAKLAQIVVGVTPDGVLGEKSLAALNNSNEQGFKMAFALAKIARYRDIVAKDKTQLKFLMGWINRTLKGLS